VSELVHWGQDVVLHVYANPLNADWVPSSKGVCRHIVPLPPQRELWPFRLFWQHVLFPVRAALDRLDLVHFLFDTSWIWGPVPSVVTIHDTISDVYYPTRFPGAVPDLKARYLFRAKRHAARTSRAVICPSHATAEGVTEAYGLRRGHVRIVPEGVRIRSLDIAADKTVRGDYVLTVASLSPDKNIGTLIRAMRRLGEQYGIRRPLHIIGMPGAAPHVVRSELGEVRGVDVVYRGWVSDNELQRAYRECAAFAFVPLVEGFGLPPLEAMAGGAPVVASAVSSLQDVCGEAALLVAPEDEDAIADALRKVLYDPVLRNSLISRGRQQVRLFPWSATAERTIAVYREVLAGRPAATDGPNDAGSAWS